MGGGDKKKGLAVADPAAHPDEDARFFTPRRSNYGDVGVRKSRCAKPARDRVSGGRCAAAFVRAVDLDQLAKDVARFLLIRSEIGLGSDPRRAKKGQRRCCE